MSDYDVRNNLISMLESYLVFRKVPQADRVRIAAQFKQLDKNLDGLISIGELIQAYNKMEGGLNV